MRTVAMLLTLTLTLTLTACGPPDPEIEAATKRRNCIILARWEREVHGAPTQELIDACADVVTITP